MMFPLGVELQFCLSYYIYVLHQSVCLTSYYCVFEKYHTKYSYRAIALQDSEQSELMVGRFLMETDA